MDLDEEQRPMRMEEDGGGLGGGWRRIRRIGRMSRMEENYRRIEGNRCLLLRLLAVGVVAVWLFVPGCRWWLNFSNRFGVVFVVCSWLFDWRRTT